jgi:hypothetical protein
MATDQKLHALLVTFTSEELAAFKTAIGTSLETFAAEAFYKAWHDPAATLEKQCLLLASTYRDPCLKAIIKEFTTGRDARLKAIVARIAKEEIEKIRVDLPQYLEPAKREEFDLVWDLSDDTNRLALLTSRYATAFRKTLLSRYIDDLYGGIEHAIVNSTSSEDATSKNLRLARLSSLRWRMVFGVLFALIGGGLVASNLWVLPAMAKRISTNTEHPAAIAIEGLQQYLKDSAGNTEQQTAFKAISDMAGTVSDITTSVNNLNENVKSLRSSVPQVDSKSPAENPSFVALTSALSDVRPPADATERAAWTPEKSFALYLIAEQATANARAQDIGVWRLSENLSDQYLIVPRSAVTFDGQAAQKVRDALTSLQTHHTLVTNRKVVMDRMSRYLEMLEPETGEGLIDAFTKQNALIDESGQALRELVVTAPKLAESARAATDTLSSVADFVVPYAFAVLAIGAMLVTLGITSVLKSLRLRDDVYDEAVDVNRALMLGRLAVAFRAQDSKPDAIIERIARIGERVRKGEGGVPLPLARAVTELVDVLKKP